MRIKNSTSRFSVLVALLVSACGDGPLGLEHGYVDLREPWRTAAASDVGADESRIEAAIDQARTNSRLLTLLAVSRGRLVVEEYFRGNHADSLNDVRSVTKSVVSALTGEAIERGVIANVDAPISDYLHPDIAALEPEEQAITVGNLLTMTSGFEWDESGGFGSYIDWISSTDHIAYLLGQPLIDTPGTVFRYNSAAVHLLGVVLEAASGMSLPELAYEYLFRDIGIETVRWEPLTDGYHNGGSGVDLRPRDLARFGQLFLQRGFSGETRILSDAWITQSTQAQFPWRTTAGPVDGVSYGFLWWVATGEPEPAFFAWGYGGQFIYVVPELELVVVATTEWQGVSQDGGPAQYERAALDVIADQLVPAFRNR